MQLHCGSVRRITCRNVFGHHTNTCIGEQISGLRIATLPLDIVPVSYVILYFRRLTQFVEIAETEVMLVVTQTLTDRRRAWKDNRSKVRETNIMLSIVRLKPVDT